MKRFLRLVLILTLPIICISCGDTFRPVIIPNPPAFPDPRAAHTVVSINDNNTVLSNPPSADRGSVMVIDVSGDSEVSVHDVSFHPVHAVQQTASQVLVVNQSVQGLTGASLTKVLFSGTTIASTTEISLPDNSAPNFVAVAPSDTTAYVALSSLASVAAVNTSSSTVATFSVGGTPVAMAVTPDKSKLYVATSNSFTGFNTIDRTPRQLLSNIGNRFSSPAWVVTRSDNQRVYVLDQGNGSLITVDPTASGGTADNVLASLSVGAGRSMLYDSNLNRIYVPSASQLAVVDVAHDPPRLLTTVAISAVDPSARASFDPCLATAPTPITVVAAAALPDGSRVYAGAFYTDANGNLCPQVTSINTTSNTVKTDIPVPGVTGLTPASAPVCTNNPFRFTMAAGGDSSRVYLASCDGGNVNVIQTSNDTYILNLPAPASSRTHPPGTQPPPQNPVFLLAGP